MRGRRAERLTRGFVVSAAVCVLAAALTPNTRQDAGAQVPMRGGKVIFRAVGGPDWIDPGLTYYSFGFMLSNAVNRTLYSFSPE